MVSLEPRILDFGLGGFIPKEAPDYVLKQPSGLLLHKLADHVAKYGADSVEALIRGTNVVESVIVE